MANYEMMLIVNPTISEEDRNASINELKELFKTNSVKIVKEDIWWDKKLAYKINKSDRGFYILFDFSNILRGYISGSERNILLNELLNFIKQEKEPDYNYFELENDTLAIHPAAIERLGEEIKTVLKIFETEFTSYNK